eukprot:TRINITY_DN9602_c0_g3_i1.p1 TRINITY_DN9602_c0_g3~~TRINITY_DN9602_c0_g3_i1.p1  ORF type:complete len:397 (+),score=108.74 TRINITY_DN9602_c0_g3_i1:47-1192(+)
MPRAVLLTGATGVVGDAVARGLLARHVGPGKRWDRVYAFTRRQPLLRDDRVVPVTGSMESVASVVTALKTFDVAEVDTVVNCAAAGVKPPELGVYDVAGSLQNVAKVLRTLLRVPWLNDKIYASLELRQGFGPDGDLNISMAHNFWTGVAEAAPSVQNAVQMTGAKASGMHLAMFWPGFQAPQEESQRHPGRNWYLNVEEGLAKEAERKGWRWAALRPSFFIGHLSSGFNVAAYISSVAVTCQRHGTPFYFPGSPTAFECQHTLSDGDMCADTIEWAAGSQASVGPLNVCNMTPFRWSELWPRVGEYYGIQALPPRAEFERLVIDSDMPMSEVEGFVGQCVMCTDTMLSPRKRLALGWDRGEDAWDVLRRGLDLFGGRAAV